MCVECGCKNYCGSGEEETGVAYDTFGVARKVSGSGVADELGVCCAEGIEGGQHGDG